MNKEFFKITGLYTIGVVVFFYMLWFLLGLALPEAKLDLVRALSTAFGINLPDDLIVEAKMGFRAVIVVVIIAVLSIGLIILNVFFGAIVTARFVQPRIQLLTSARGVLSTKWNISMPYVLVRLSNFHRCDLVDVKINAALTIEETRMVEGSEEQFMSTLPITDFTPQRILFMAPKMPWSIAVPADSLLSNSMTKDYHFKPGEPITKSFSAGKTLVSAKRHLLLLLEGTDSNSYSRFVMHRRIPIDEQNGDTYTLHLHRGSFKSLPLNITDAGELEKFAEAAPAVANI